MRECPDDFVQLFARINKCEPSDAEVKAHLYFLGRFDLVFWITLNIILKLDTKPEEA